METTIKPYLFILLTMLVACSSSDENRTAKDSRNDDLPRIAIAGLAIESSTFSPAVTHAQAFHARTGDEVFSFYPFLAPGSADRERAHWIPTLVGHALPGGIVTRGAYDSLVTQTLAPTMAFSLISTGQ